MNLTGRHRKILLQSLGILNDESRPHRRHYYADATDYDLLDCCENMVQWGMLRRGGLVKFGMHNLWGTDRDTKEMVVAQTRNAYVIRVYWITPEGVEAIDGPRLEAVSA